MQNNSIEQGTSRFLDTSMTRRTALKAIAIAPFVALAGLEAACSIPATPQPVQSQRERGITPPTPEPTVSANDQVLQREIRRLGIKGDLEEKQRWQTRGFSRSEIPLPIDRTTEPEAAKRVATTINLMAESSNKDFSERATLFKALKGEAFYEFAPKTRLGNRVMGTLIDVEDGKIVYYIGILPDFVLNQANTTLLASGLVHEIEHIINMKKFIDSLPTTMPGEEKKRTFEIMARQEEQQVNEEAMGYGIQAKALIRQRGLLGYNDFKGTPEEEYAAQFIQRGSNIESPEWKTYIRNLLRRIKGS